MNEHVIREKIKLNTEWFRYLFASFLLIGSGTIAIISKNTGNLEKTDLVIMCMGVIVEIVILAGVFYVNGEIKKLIKQLQTW